VDPLSSRAVSAPPAPAFARAQREAFALTWLVYTAYYLVRKDFDGAKPGM